MRQEAWSVVSALRADIRNVLVTRKADLIHPNDCNPMLKGAAKRKGVKKSGVLMPSDIARMAAAGAFGKAKGK